MTAPVLNTLKTTNTTTPSLKRPISAHRRAARWALPIPIAALLGVTLFYAAAERARQVTEAQTWQVVATALALPQDADRAEIRAQLASHADAQRLAKRARVAQQLGVSLNWTHLCKKMEALSPQQQEAVLTVLQEEYRFAPHFNLSQVKEFLLRGEARATPSVNVMREKLSHPLMKVDSLRENSNFGEALTPKRMIQ